MLYKCICALSALLNRGVVFSFHLSVLLPLIQFCSQVMMALKVFWLQLSVPSEIEAWVKSRRTRGGQFPLDKLSYLEFRFTSRCFVRNKQWQRFSSVYMHSLSKKNFDSPLFFAVQTFQQLSSTDMVFCRQRNSNLALFPFTTESLSI